MTLASPTPCKGWRGAWAPLQSGLVVSTVIKQMGRQFVLGETIQAAMTRAAREEAQGFTFSYDMLGEAALTAADADRFRLTYQDAITAIAARCTAAAVADNPAFRSSCPRFTLATRLCRLTGCWRSWCRWS